MKQTDRIKDNLFPKQNPFTISEGYFDCIESRINDRIDHPVIKNRVWAVAKPALLLACSFLLIFGIGYGTLSLTNTLKQDSPTLASEIDEESFDSFMNDLYNAEVDLFDINDEISEEEMYQFFSEYYSTHYLEGYFASFE